MKGIATVMVVYIHSHNIYGYAGVSDNNLPVRLITMLTLSSAAVPTFFLLSAYLISKSKRTYVDNIKKKAKTLLLPYAVWMVLYLLFEIVGTKLAPNEFSHVSQWSVSDWLKSLIGVPFVEPPIYMPLWFVRDLFILNLVAPPLRFIAKKLPYYVTLLIVGIVWFLPLPSFLRQAFCFFMLGLLIGSKETAFMRVSEKCHGGGIVIAGILTVATVFLPTGYCTERIQAILAVALLYLACKALDRSKKPKCKCLSVIKVYSFWIYVTHGKLLSIFQILCTKVFTQSGGMVLAEYLVLPLIIIAICLMVGIGFQRIWPRAYSILTGER